jgi:hypothetical protein
MKRGIKKGLFALIFIVFFISVVSADKSNVFFDTQSIKTVYNLGDNLEAPITLSYPRDISGTLTVNTICNGTVRKILNWEALSLKTGVPKVIPFSFQISGISGLCVLQAVFSPDNSNPALSSEFKISNWLSVTGSLEKSVFDAGETFALSGKVTKETGENSNGLVEASIDTKDINQEIKQLGTITDGNFAFNISIPSALKAGNYNLKVKAYEEDSNGAVTNSGNAEYNISVNQVPTNLELIFESKEIDPGSSLIVNAILHDQTGDPINSSIFVTIKDSADKILEEKEINMGESIIYPIAQGTAPAEWKVFAVSNKLTSEETFLIKTKESIAVQIVNKTIGITNNGNVFYNKTLLVKIEDNPLNIQVVLDVGQTKKYILSAPNGEYTVRVLSDDGNEVSETMSLTGNAIGIKEQGSNLTTLAFILLGLIILIGGFLLFKKIKKRSSFGGWFRREKFQKSKVKESKPLPVMNETAIVTPVNKAEISLSIKGEKQEASVVGLKIKNLRECRVKKGSCSDTLKQIINMAEDNKAVTYENNDYLLFLLAPTKTRTMKNEKTALDIAQEMQSILMNHNRMFNQKMDYGISLNKGSIVAKIEGRIFKFMGIGSIIGVSKKIATLSDGEVLLSEEINNLLRVNMKSDKETRDGFTVYVLDSVKKEGDEATKKFINRFMERQKKG